MPRIIAGQAGGRRIRVPRKGVRPTAQRVRESLFASLAADRDFDGLVVLDLFAGSGALGLEALSRGAGRAIAVESDRITVGTIKENAAALGLAGQLTVLAADVFAALRRGRGRLPQVDLVFADPPYSMLDSAVRTMVGDLVGKGWLADQARVVIERRIDSAALDWPSGYGLAQSRVIGDTAIQRAVWYGPGWTRPTLRVAESSPFRVGGTANGPGEDHDA